MAWLHAVPRPPAGTQRAKAEAPKHSRLELLKKDGITPKMPPNPMPHIVDRLVEIGLTEAAGPLSWLTLDAWQRNTGVTLAPWEARLLRRLSAAYVAEGRAAEDENSPPPWRAEVTQRERETEEARLRLVLG